MEAIEREVGVEKFSGTQRKKSDTTIDILHFVRTVLNVEVVGAKLEVHPHNCESAKVNMPKAIIVG
jgi:hypothetical protein